jgi:hypothetical protein
MLGYFQSIMSPNASVIVAKPVGSNSQGASLISPSALGQTGQTSMQTPCGTAAPAQASLMASIFAKPDGASSGRLERLRQKKCSSGHPITQTIMASDKTGFGSCIGKDQSRPFGLTVVLTSFARIAKESPNPTRAPTTGTTGGKTAAPANDAKAVATAAPPVRLAPAKEKISKASFFILSS